jgi:hypothetical protein
LIEEINDLRSLAFAEPVCVGCIPALNAVSALNESNCSTAARMRVIEQKAAKISRLLIFRNQRRKD